MVHLKKFCLTKVSKLLFLRLFYRYKKPRLTIPKYKHLLTLRIKSQCRLVKNALATTMDMLVSAFIHKKYKETLDAFDLLVWNTREIIRPGRSNPRNKRQKKPYSMNYKSLFENSKETSLKQPLVNRFF